MSDDYLREKSDERLLDWIRTCREGTVRADDTVRENPTDTTRRVMFAATAIYLEALNEASRRGLGLGPEGDCPTTEETIEWR